MGRQELFIETGSGFEADDLRAVKCQNIAVKAGQAQRLRHGEHAVGGAPGGNNHPDAPLLQMQERVFRFFRYFFHGIGDSTVYVQNQ